LEERNAPKFENFVMEIYHQIWEQYE